MEEASSATTAVATSATAPTPSISIPQNQTANASNTSLVNSSNAGGLMCVVGQDGQTLILSDAEGRENIISGVTPDILQQVRRIMNDIDEVL